jgi:hypothetical protein
MKASRLYEICNGQEIAIAHPHCSAWPDADTDAGTALQETSWLHQIIQIYDLL